MVTIRAVEDKVNDIFSQGLVRGSTHTCQGQEAVAVGLAAVLRPTDHVVCTYRCHGMALALGVSVEAVIGEILGKALGSVRGLGGSMHLFDANAGLLPTMAIVGAGLPLAVGAGLSNLILERDGVAVAVFGDGASNIGAFHESLNLASVWKLPVIFVCENNLYGEYSPLAATTSVANIADRACSYGMPSEIVDGQDVDEVELAASRAADRARRGEGPTLLEMKTYRYVGHSRTDPATYRPDGELEEWLRRDPITTLHDRLMAEGSVDELEIERLTESANRLVEDAVDVLLDSDPPHLSELFRYVYAPS